MKTGASPGKGYIKIARRSFLHYAGAGVAGMGILTAATSCKKYHISPSSGPIDVGSGDTGILNYAYALEQLEAAFYTQVIATPYASMPATELALLTDIRDHEICHREFFKAALSSGAIQSLTPDFSTIDFTSRTAVLTAAKTFEDLGVTAYDGVGYLIKNTDYLTVAGKIVSVEARHAALIDNLLGVNFAGTDQLDANAVNISNKPSVVLAAANNYLKTKVSAKSFS